MPPLWSLTNAQTLIVRRVDPQVARQLRIRAVEQDLSAEELHRRILVDALGERRIVADLVRSLRRMGDLGLALDPPAPESP